MRSMYGCVALALMALSLGACPTLAMTREVPNQDPDIQTAIGKLAAMNNHDPDNWIWLTQTPLYTNQPIAIGNAFNPGKRLTIAPKPGVLSRVEILNGDPNGEIVTLAGTGGVTLRALDLIRDITNLSNLMTISTSEDVLMERCRLGYTNVSKGGSQLDMLQITYPNHVVIRNCILFSLMPGEFDRAIHVLQFGDPQNALYLYNNDVANYGKEGVRIALSTADSALLVMRNNVAVNDPAVVPEPVAYSSGHTIRKLRLRTSYNAAFASPASIEQMDPGLPGPADVAGATQLDFLRLDASAAEEDGDFITRSWDTTPGAINADFYELNETAGLHSPSAYGVTVLDGAPTPFDIAVADDIDHEGRPSPGSDPHTDRGADQVDPALIAAAVGPLRIAAELSAAPLRNPSPAIALAYAAREAGELTADVFDAQGRRLWSTRRSIGPGATGVLSGPAARTAGAAFYRVRLTTAAGGVHETGGKIVLLQ